MKIISIFDQFSRKEIHIPQGVRIIGNGAFENDPNLVSVTIPDSVCEIRSSAFYHCSSLTKVKIHGRVKVIEKDAFRGCINLNTVEMLEGLEIIGERMHLKTVPVYLMYTCLIVFKKSEVMPFTAVEN